jgi:REP element-mobilizing transposase RayT
MRKLKFQADHYYHLYNRGVNRRPIFFNAGNWHFFMKRLRHYCRAEWVDVLAYCLMPNHFHLLVYLKVDDLGMRIMHPFTISYTKAVNKQQDRVGHLFQGTFQAQHVDRLSYLVHLSRYIHRNPVDAALVRRPEDWRFSSYGSYLGGRPDGFCYPATVLTQFPSRRAYIDYVESTGDHHAFGTLEIDGESV